MTTPNINSVYSVINDAYEDAGLKQDADDLTGEQLAKGLKRLRDVLNFFQTKGLKVFLWADTEVPLVAGQAVYTFKPGGSVDMTKPLRVLQAWYLYASNNARRPVTVMSANDYYLLGMAGTLATNQGTISQYYVEKLYDQLKVTFWLCPDSVEATNGAMHLLLQIQWANPTELDETLQFAPEWRMAVRWALSADLATGQPAAVIERCENNKMIYMDAMEGWDVEDAPTSYQPDPQGGYHSNFR